MEDKNTAPFPFDPSILTAVCITHAHADHIGRLPKLYKDGFRGAVHATKPTRELSQIMLADALKVMRYEYEDGGAEPIYDESDLEGVMRLFVEHPYDTSFTVEKDITITLRDSAHVLGSAMIEVQYNGVKTVLTGDLGNTPSPLLNDMYPLQHADFVVMESVYGDRDHEHKEERKLLLERLIEDTFTKGGTILIPAFALERTQELLADINELIEHHRVPAMPVFVDSPLASAATEVYKQNTDFFNPTAQEAMKRGDDLFSFPGLKFTPSKEESKQINAIFGPKIIIAGNPHGDGSRIAYHFSRYLSDERSAVLFVGFQRPGSMGRRLAEGADFVKVHGQELTVKVRIEHLYAYSGHADRTQLLEFVSRLQKPIKKIFVAMGEPDVADKFAVTIRDQYGLDAVAPHFGDSASLDV